MENVRNIIIIILNDYGVRIYIYIVILLKNEINTILAGCNGAITLQQNSALDVTGCYPQPEFNRVTPLVHLFSLVVLELMDSIDPPQELLLQLWYLDDGSFVGPRTAISDLLTQISKNGPKFGLHLNMKKCEVFWPSGDQFFSEFPEEVCRVRDKQGGVELLGSPVWGTSDFIKSFVATQVGRILELQSCLGDLEDPQAELHLLRSCLSTGKISHLLRTVPPGSADEHFRHFDEGLRSTLSQILRCTISDSAWLQATLPFRLGGLGLRESLRTAPIAFLASCRNTYLLVAQLLHRDTNPIFYLPGEMDNLEYLKQLLPNFDPLPGDIAQRSVQVASDRVLWAQLLDSSNLRDAVRLNTQSGGKHTYAWLQAIPHPNLGLSMSSSEFSIALRYWLGIPLFRGSHLHFILAPVALPWTNMETTS